MRRRGVEAIDDDRRRSAGHPGAMREDGAEQDGDEQGQRASLHRLSVRTLEQKLHPGTTESQPETTAGPGCFSGDLTGPVRRRKALARPSWGRHFGTAST